MKWLGRIIDRLADTFGDLPFIIAYNAGTFVWFLLGIYDKHFIDPYPNNFLTFLMSWAAINMTSFLLWSDRRKAERARRDEEHQRQTLEAILTIVEAQADITPLIRQMVENQVVILTTLAEQEGVKL